MHACDYREGNTNPRKRGQFETFFSNILLCFLQNGYIIIHYSLYNWTFPHKRAATLFFFLSSLLEVKIQL